jgi:DNA-binding Lrp family transcriptional regulator
MGNRVIDRSAVTLIPQLDDADRQIVAALQLNGRASWRSIAAALDASESTVTRRGQQLLADRTVAVTGVLDHLRCGLGISVYVRLRAKPGRALAVARAVAAHPRPRFVTVTTGSFDVTAEVVVPHHRDILQVIGEFEGVMDDVVETESMLVIRKFSAFEEWVPATVAGAATDALRSGRDVVEYDHRTWTEPERLTATDLAIAAVLAGDGRASYATIAQRVETSESTVARRVESLVERGCLRFRTLFETPVLGYDVEFILWLTVDPAHVEEVGERLAKHPATRYVAAATGRHSLILQGVLPGYGDLYPYTTEVVSQLPGVQSADLTLQVQALKRAWTPIDDDGRPRPQEPPELLPAPAP